MLVRVKTEFQGKHKLADRWEPKVHIVVRKVNKDIPVYEIRPERSSGRNCTLHRYMLLPCNHLPVPDVTEHPTKPTAGVEETLTTKPRRSHRLQGRSESDDDEEDDCTYALKYQSLEPTKDVHL